MLVGEGVEVGVVAGVSAECNVVLDEADDLAVDGEQLLHEGAPEVQQGHVEPLQVVGHVV